MQRHRPGLCNTVCWLSFNYYLAHCLQKDTFNPFLVNFSCELTRQYQFQWLWKHSNVIDFCSHASWLFSSFALHEPPFNNKVCICLRQKDTHLPCTALWSKICGQVYYWKFLQPMEKGYGSMALLETVVFLSCGRNVILELIIRDLLI